MVNCTAVQAAVPGYAAQSQMFGVSRIRLRKASGHLPLEAVHGYATKALGTDSAMDDGEIADENTR
jgi:hypothetical protein